MNDPLKNIDANKRTCTGVPLDYTEPPNLNPACNSEAEFDSVVSDYYRLFRERLRKDVSFLKSAGRHADIDDFDSTVYLLRTAKQHDDNREAVTFYETWVVEHRPWRQAAIALAEMFARCIQRLEVASGRVRRDPSLSAAWREHASIEPEAVFLAVCDDLQVRFSPSNRQRMVRNVSKQLQRIKAGDDIRTATEHLCAQEITAQLRPLPMPYFEVLDRLDLIGKHHAKAALLVAYSIRTATNLKGEEFLLRVEETWKVVRA
ncbi:hypothetical protein [Nocardia thailandica]